MVRLRIHPEKLHIHQMTQRSQRMPHRGMRAGERPTHGFPIESLLHIFVVHDVNGVVIRKKLEASGRVKKEHREQEKSSRTYSCVFEDLNHVGAAQFVSNQRLTSQTHNPRLKDERAKRTHQVPLPVDRCRHDREQIRRNIRF